MWSFVSITRSRVPPGLNRQYPLQRRRTDFAPRVPVRPARRAPRRPLRVGPLFPVLAAHVGQLILEPG